MDGLTPVFWQNTLPLMVTVLVAVFGATSAAWFSNKNLGARVDDLRTDLDRRFGSMDRRFDSMEHRLERIENKLDDHGNRITAVEERTSPFRR